MSDKTADPYDIILKKKNYHEKPDFLKGDLDDVLDKKKDPVSGFFDWWNNLPVKPFVSFDCGPEAPDGHAITIGIKGSF